ncbi:MAG: TIGR00282 family metallophosphoesterase [Oscillospiraceae bacterium]|nr:TIGR00282 family metallophosphoesterase [Oscillospiraceae bacterium]
MIKKILAVGDVVASNGLEFLKANLPALKKEHGVDFCVVNGENAAVLGITPRQADTIYEAGADVITMGNHTWGRREIIPYIERNPRMLRPANYPSRQPGKGWGLYESSFGPVAVIDLIGRCNMDYTPDNPFLEVERILKKLQTKLILVELHAEATSEKLAMGWMLDGRVSAVWGTHTHVQTADDRVLPRGTGYITDLGMTGPRNSILGIQPELSIRRFKGEIPQRYEPAAGSCKLEGCLFHIETDSGLCKKTERILIYD